MISITDNFFESLDHFKNLLGDFELFKAADEDKWQGERSLVLDEINPEAYAYFIESFKRNFPFENLEDYNRINAVIHSRTDDFVFPHTDGEGKNCLVYLSGEVSQFNGTGFYTQISEDNYVLNMTVGFQENRATLFPADHLHACLNSLGNLDTTIPRYTLNVFLKNEPEEK